MSLGGFLRTLIANTLTAGFGRAISKKALGLMSPMPSSRSEAYLDFGFWPSKTLRPLPLSGILASSHRIQKERKTLDGRYTEQLIIIQK
jgi:hypothetical protein